MTTKQTAKEHQAADARCGREWECQCGACNTERGKTTPDAAATRRTPDDWLKAYQAQATEIAALREALELSIATIERIGTRHGPFSSYDGTLSVARAALAGNGGGK